MVDNDLNIKLRNIRVSNGLTQSELSKRSGASISTIRRFEQTGKVSLETFLDILKVYNLDKKLFESISPKFRVMKTKSGNKRITEFRDTNRATAL